MTQTVIAGGVDKTATLLTGSLTVKLNTADFRVTGQITAVPGDVVTIAEPNWTGTVSAILMRPAVEGNFTSAGLISTVSAVNTLTGVTPQQAPFTLNPTVTAASTDLYELEDGSGTYLLESGTAFDDGTGSYLLESTQAVGYERFEITVQRNADGSTSTLVRLRIFTPGIQVGQTVNVSWDSVATNYIVTQVLTTFPLLPSQPFFDIDLGTAVSDIQTFHSVFKI